MGWNKDGSTVKADYCGTSFTGIVLDSRVKYGGKVQYKVEAPQPFWVHDLGAFRSVVLIDDEDLIADFGVLNEPEQV